MSSASARLNPIVRTSRGWNGKISHLGSQQERVSTKAQSPHELDSLVKHIRQGDLQTIRLLREAATVLGRLVASMVNVINPARIVLGGAIAAASDDLLAGVRSGVYNRAMPLATRNLTLAHSVLGPVAGVVGGAVSAIEHVLSPEGLTHALTTGSTPPGSTSQHPQPTADNLSRS